ncbi:MAG: 2-aminobenzoate-CoA ligase, partial [Alphaproteobacteria bacterium]
LIGTGAPDAPAVVNDSGTWTYTDMRALSDRIARLLVEEEGLVPGNRVLLRGPNTASMFAAWLAVLKAGGVVVATMPMLRAGEVATVIDRAQVSHAIVDRRCLEDYLPAAEQVRSLLTYDGDAGTGPLERRLASVSEDFQPVDTHRDDPALIAFTSGNILKPSAADRWLCSAPVAFTFGLGMQLIFPWRFGGAAVTIEQGGPKLLLDAVARHRVTTLATAPTAYKAMIPLLADQDLSSLRTCVSAGEHLPAATWQAWRDATDIPIVDGIGATEMMHIFISAVGDDIRPGATGKAVPGYRACVLGEDGNPLPHGTGRLAVRGPTGCRYLDDERQSAYVQGGWNVTGDTYRADQDGYFWYVARSDDMIVSAGYNIAAPEVENALYAHPAGPELTAELQAHVKAAIAPYKYPREVEFVDALPKTATGKLQRFALK